MCILSNDNVFSGLIMSIYLPCDTFTNILSVEYVDTVDYIEQLFTSVNFNSLIACGHYDTCIMRNTVNTECLLNFVSRNDLHISWDHTNANCDLTYVNHSLKHKSTTDILLLVQTFLKPLLIMRLYLTRLTLLITMQFS